MTSLRPRFASTLLLSAALSTACTPKPEGETEGAADTETTTAPGDTETTADPGATEGATDPGATGSTAATETTAAPGDTETTVEPGDTETTVEPGDSETTAEPFVCEPRDPELADYGFAIDFGDWPVMGDPDDDLVGTWIELSAECVVQSGSHTSGEVELELVCTQGDIADVTIALSLTVPTNFRTDAELASVVKLDAFANSEFHHTSAGAWFVLREVSTGNLLLAGQNTPDKPMGAGLLHPLSISGETDPDCILPNTDESCQPDDFWRGKVTFSHADGPSFPVHDGSRSLIGANGRSHELLLKSYTTSLCLGYFPTSSWIVGADVLE